MDSIEKETDKELEEEVLKRLELESKFKNGVGWFYWIAALSAINSIVMYLGSEWNFIVGLGITQIVDGLGIGLAESYGMLAQAVAVSINIIVVLLVAGIGSLARKGRIWAIIAGMIFYFADGLIFLYFKDFLPFGFHIFALFNIYSGLKALKELKNNQAANGDVENEEAVVAN
jgi:hypothetical protein